MIENVKRRIEKKLIFFKFLKNLGFNEQWRGPKTGEQIIEGLVNDYRADRTEFELGNITEQLTLPVG